MLRRQDRALGDLEELLITEVTWFGGGRTGDALKDDLVGWDGVRPK